LALQWRFKEVFDVRRVGLGELGEGRFIVAFDSRETGCCRNIL
jgi:hypothetical protein